jgi:hypothetical protein
MHRERFKSCYSGTDPVASSSSICLTRGVISHAGSALLRFDDFAPQLDQIAIERRAVQFFFLARDHDGGDAIANQVDERAATASPAFLRQETSLPVSCVSSSAGITTLIAIIPRGENSGRKKGVWTDPVMFKEVIVPWIVHALDVEPATK